MSSCGQTTTFRATSGAGAHEPGRRVSPVSLPVLPARAAVPVTVALAGNPNAGKTTLFNQLTGMRGKTANFAGTTTSVRLGSFELDGKSIQLLDLPGLYAMSEHKTEERTARDALLGKLAGRPRPQAAIVVVDATNLARNLYLAGQVRELGVPMVIALNMIDLAEADGLEIDTESLAVELGTPVVAVSSRSGRGFDLLKRELAYVLDSGPDAMPALPEGIAACGTCTTCPHEARYDWAEEVGARAVRAQGTGLMSLRLTEAIDRWLTHPIHGVAGFVLIMAAVFISIFTVAQYPMAWIEAGFGFAGDVFGAILPPGDLNSFVVNGLIGGIGGVLVFLPQICFLFFLITLLEDSGYLARAAFVADRPMSRVGLPGRAFVPMLSAHACAIPAIMSTRVIENWRDRLVSILVIPLLTCTARLPVYVMITALLFADRPVVGGLVFTGAYLLGMTAAIGMAFVFKSTILPGASSPLVIELPRYRLPSLRNALLTAYDRGRAFVTRAGTIILGISVVLWVLATYPKLDESEWSTVVPAETIAQVADLRAAVAIAGDEAEAEALKAEAGALLSAYELEYSVAGRVGKAVEPVFAPLGFDWKINVGVISSFAAREVIVATLAIVYGIGEDAAEEEETLSATLRAQRHADGSPVFTTATALALLVFFVLAMQCLPTNVVTRRETGSWKWPALQFGYMTVLAWTAAFVVYQVVSAFA